MNNVLQQEVDRYNKLLDIIFKSISTLVKAIKGEIMISKSSESVLNSFLSQKVPSFWASSSYPSLKPLASWVKNLLARTKYFSLWCRNLILYVEGAFGSMNPSSLWISGFFYPQGLLAAISQNYARKYHVSIDSLQFVFTIQNQMLYTDESSGSSVGIPIDELFENEQKYDTNGQEGILLCGFFMDGGKWDTSLNLLVDSPQRYNLLPHILCKLVMVKLNVCRCFTLKSFIFYNFVLFFKERRNRCITTK
jgi:dynein heavy chain, axonemal